MSVPEQFIYSGTSFEPITYSCPNKLVEARFGNRLVVFAGSGISSPTERPNWSELISALMEKCTADELVNPKLEAARFLISQSEDAVYTKLVPAIVKEEIGEAAFNERLMQALEHELVTCAARYHDLLIKLGPVAIITTNYDLCFETCFQENHRDWKVTTVEGLAQQTPRVTSKTIYHLHGLEKRPASIIVGLSDYTRLYRRDTVALKFLQDVFENYAVLFAGCSMRDEEILGELMDSSNRSAHYGLAESDSPGALALRCLGIGTTEYEIVSKGRKKSHKNLEKILSDWASDLSSRNPIGQEVFHDTRRD